MQNRLIEHFRGWTTSGDPHEGASGKSEMKDAAIHQLERGQQAAARFVASHPLICLSAGVAAGIAVGWWVKRK